MSITTRRSSRYLAFVLRSFAFACVAIPGIAGAGPAIDPISVSVDQAKLIKLPERISTIVVGNPLIADVTLQPGGMIVVTGKGYGATNVLAMDRRGEVLIDRVINVESPTDQVVTIYRGIDRESYSCMPVCQRRVTLGDSEKYFNTAINQGGALTDKATGAATKDKP